MLELFLTRSLTADTLNRFHQHSVTRMRPVQLLITTFGALAFLTFTIGRSVLADSLAPFHTGLPVAVALLILAWSMQRAVKPSQVGLFGVAYLALLQVGALLNTAGTPSPLLWLLPSALLLPICSAPFWIQRRHFLAASAASFAIAFGYGSTLPLTREELVVSVMWCVIGIFSALTFHVLAYSYRLHHFLLEGRLADLAATDPLTGLPNRRAFMKRAQRILQDCAEQGLVASAMFIDLDCFKSINDNFGHAAGDEILRTVAHTLDMHTRTEDLVGRIGGEEFAVLLTASPLPAALEVAERLRVRIGELKRPDGHVTASIGVAEYIREESLASLLERADQAMLDAKERGRNRVVVASGAPVAGAYNRRRRHLAR